MLSTRSKVGPVALAAALALGLSACDGGPLDVEGGRVVFVLSSAADAPAGVVADGSTSTIQASTVEGGPALHDRDDDDDDHKERMWNRNPFFQSANVTFSSISARNYDGQLVDAGMELPATIDVVSMEDGRSVTLPDGDLPVGTYDQVVVVMTAVQGITHDGTTITIEPPGGGWTAIIPICPFDVADGETAVVGLELSLDRSFFWRNNRFGFEPHFECEQPVEETTEETPTEG